LYEDVAASRINRDALEGKEWVLLTIRSSTRHSKGLNGISSWMMKGQPTGKKLPGRRESVQVVPVPAARRRGPRQREFPRPKHGRICVKVINHFGDEVQKVFQV
jgi:hypothetical protein